MEQRNGAFSSEQRSGVVGWYAQNRREPGWAAGLIIISGSAVIIVSPLQRDAALYNIIIITIGRYYYINVRAHGDYEHATPLRMLF
jgi:hypothetical protein